MKYRKLFIIAVAGLMMLCTSIHAEVNSLSMNKVNDNAQRIALLEEKIRVLTAEKEALLKENTQLQNDLIRIKSFYEEIEEEIRWYIELAESPLLQKKRSIWLVI